MVVLPASAGVMMIARKGQVYDMVKKAGDKVLGTKFCFSCQRHRPIETGKVFQRKGSRVWRCSECAIKMNHAGFTKEKQNE
jgi:hypothetical protein